MLGVLPGVVGTLQATEAVKLLLGIGDPLIGRQLRYDALAMEFVELKMHRDPNCPVCSKDPSRSSSSTTSSSAPRPCARRSSVIQEADRLDATVRMPPILRQAVGGAREVDADGATVRELLDDLTSRYPCHPRAPAGRRRRAEPVRQRVREQRGRASRQGAGHQRHTRVDRDRAAGHGRGRALAMGCLETRAGGGAVGGRQHAAGGAAADRPAGGRAHLRQARGAEPDRLGQGPGGAVDDRGRRGLGRARSPDSGSWSRPAATPASRWR